MTMTLDMARALINKGLEEARRIDMRCCIAVVDHRGWLVALHRMDEAVTPTFDIAWGKAWTASVFRIPTSEVPRYGNPHSTNLGFDTSNWNDRLTTIPGGLPVVAGGHVLGGIGCSGGTPDQDVLICERTLDALSRSQP